MCLDAFTRAVESGIQMTVSPPAATISPNHDPRSSFLLQNAEANLKAILPADLDDLDYGGSL